MSTIPEISPSDVAEIVKLRATDHEDFAVRFGIPIRKLRAWEAGGRMSRAARALLTVIKHEPEAVERTVRSMGLQIEADHEVL